VHEGGNASWRAIRRGARRSLLAPVLAAALGGCAALIPQSPNAIFDLSAPGEAGSPRGGVQVLVPVPATVAALDTNRIAARPAPSQYAYLPDAEWSDTLPQLLQARMVEALQNVGRVRAAGLPGQGLLIDYQLVMDIRAFELRDEGAVAEFGVKLMNDRDGRVIRTRVVRHVVPAASTENAVVVAALDAAMDEAYLEIVRWAFGG
jgi:cholesterol transport system auxiliary component